VASPAVHPTGAGPGFKITSGREMVFDMNNSPVTGDHFVHRSRKRSWRGSLSKTPPKTKKKKQVRKKGAK
jgi:hypothetical protein